MMRSEVVYKCFHLNYVSNRNKNEKQIIISIISKLISKIKYMITNLLTYKTIWYIITAKGVE